MDVLKRDSLLLHWGFAIVSQDINDKNLSIEVFAVLTWPELLACPGPQQGHGSGDYFVTQFVHPC